MEDARGFIGIVISVTIPAFSLYISGQPMEELKTSLAETLLCSIFLS